MDILINVIVALVFSALGLAGGYFYRKNAMEKKIGQTEEYAKNLLDDAARKAEEKKKEAVTACDCCAAGFGRLGAKKGRIAE